MTFCSYRNSILVYIITMIKGGYRCKQIHGKFIVAYTDFGKTVDAVVERVDLMAGKKEVNS